MQVISFPVSVNEVPRGEVTVAIDGDEVLMRAIDLEAFGIAGPAWERLLTLSRISGPAKTINGAEAVALQALDPMVKYTLDQESLSLSLTIDARLLMRTSLSVQSSRPADVIYARDRSAFFNYALSSQSLRSVNVFGELGVTTSRGLLYSGFSRSSGRLIRGMTNLIIDDRDRLRRWTWGDAIATSDSLGGSAPITGLTVARNFGLDPYFVRFPSMVLGGTAFTPSRVDVYVNGVLVAQQLVPPGPFELRNLQVASGAGTTRMVVRDAFGREVVQATDYYYSTSVLARGLSEYTYSAGVIRKDFGTRNFSFGDPAAIGFHRIGITDSLTMGGRAEASRDLISGGPTMSLRTGVGDLGLTAGMSTAGGQSGWAGELSYRFMARRFGFGAQIREMSRDYSTLSLSGQTDRALIDFSSFATFAGRFGSVSLQGANLKMRDYGLTRRASLLGSIPLGSRVSALASVGMVHDPRGRHGEFYVGASVNVGSGITAAAGFNANGSHHDTTFEMSRALPIGTGVGYRVQSVYADGRRTDNASVQYQTSYGRIELAEGTPFSSRPTINIAGGVVATGSHVELTRPVQDSYALVAVPGVPDVRVYASNQLAGRTDRNGFLMVPNLLSYYGNPLRIEDKDIPMDYEIGGVEKTVAPPYRGGALVVFPVKQHRSVSGVISVVSAGATVSAALGTLTLQRGGQNWESPIGRGGEFDLEDVPVGTYDARVEFGGGTCTFRLTVPSGAVANLGRLACTVPNEPGRTEK